MCSQGRPVHLHVCLESSGFKVRSALVNLEHDVVSFKVVEVAPEYRLFLVTSCELDVCVGVCIHVE